MTTYTPIKSNKCDDIVALIDKALEENETRDMYGYLWAQDITGKWQMWEAAK